MPISCFTRVFRRHFVTLTLLTMASTKTDSMLKRPKVITEKITTASMMLTFDFTEAVKNRVVRVRYCGRCPLLPTNFMFYKRNGKQYIKNDMIETMINSISKHFIIAMTTCGHVENHIVSLMADIVGKIPDDDPFKPVMDILKKLGDGRLPPHETYIIDFFLNKGYKVEPINVCARQCFTAPAPAVPSHWNTFAYIVDTEVVDTLVNLPLEQAAFAIAAAMALKPELKEVIEKGVDLDSSKVVSTINKLKDVYADDEAIKSIKALFETMKTNNLIRFVAINEDKIMQGEYMELMEKLRKVKKEIESMRSKIVHEAIDEAIQEKVKNKLFTKKGKK